MFELKHLILVSLVFLTFGLVLCGRKKSGVEILFFFMPFFANPFRDEEYYFLLGVNAFLVWAIWLGGWTSGVIAGNGMRVKNLSPKAFVPWVFLLGGATVGLLNDRVSRLELLCGHSPVQSMVNFSLFIATLVIFASIMAEYRWDYKFQDRLCFILLLTPFAQFGSYAFYALGYEPFLPSFLVHVVHTEDGFTRFAGLLVDYELIIDYCLIIISLGLLSILEGRHRAMSLISIVLCVFIGLLSGTRSFFVASGIFSILLAVIFLVRYGITRELILMLSVGVLAAVTAYLVTSKMMPTDVIFQRLETSIYYLRKGDYAESINRDLLRGLSTLLRNSGVFGNGSMLIWRIDDDATVSHNLYFGVYAAFGLGGILFLFWLLGSSLSKLILTIIRAGERVLVERSVVFLALLLSLMVQQVKISAIRMIGVLLLYAFLFLMIDFGYSRMRARENGEHKD